MFFLILNLDALGGRSWFKRIKAQESSHTLRHGCNNSLLSEVCLGVGCWTERQWPEISLESGKSGGEQTPKGKNNIMVKICCIMELKNDSD